MDSDHEDDVEEGELVVGIDVSRDRRRLHHEALDEKEDTLVANTKLGAPATLRSLVLYAAHRCTC